MVFWESWGFQMRITRRTHPGFVAQGVRTQLAWRRAASPDHFPVWEKVGGRRSPEGHLRPPRGAFWTQNPPKKWNRDLKLNSKRIEMQSRMCKIPGWSGVRFRRSDFPQRPREVSCQKLLFQPPKSNGKNDMVKGLFIGFLGEWVHFLPWKDVFRRIFAYFKQVWVMCRFCAGQRDFEGNCNFHK